MADWLPDPLTVPTRIARSLIDAGDNAFAPRLSVLLKKACAIGQRRDKLKDATLRTYASVLEAELDKILRIKPKCETAKKILWA